MSHLVLIGYSYVNRKGIIHFLCYSVIVLYSSAVVLVLFCFVIVVFCMHLHVRSGVQGGIQTILGVFIFHLSQCDSIYVPSTCNCIYMY